MCGRNGCRTIRHSRSISPRHGSSASVLEKFDGRLDELCRDTIKNTIISAWIYGDQSHDHSEAVRYELAKLEKLDAQCWIVNAAEKYLEDRQ